MNQVSVHPPAPAAPRVSVVIPCFNQGRYLDEAIQSAIQQTGVQPEVIVVDDASTDATARIASSHPQVRLVRLSRNGGLANARNAGLGIATGEFVVFLDADDYLRPGALAAGVGCLIAEPDAGLAFGRYVRVNDHGAVIDSPEPIDIHEDAYSALLARNFVEMIATVTFRTEAIEQAGGLDRSLRACEDYDLLLRIARTKRVLQHNTTAACYRMHDRNMSSNNALMLRTSIRALRKQRSHAQETAARRHGYSTGLHFWQMHYGGLLLREVLADARNVRTIPRAASKLATLVRHVQFAVLAQLASNLFRNLRARRSRNHPSEDPGPL